MSGREGSGLMVCGCGEVWEGRTLLGLMGYVDVSVSAWLGGGVFISRKEESVQDIKERIF